MPEKDPRELVRKVVQEYPELVVDELLAHHFFLKCIKPGIHYQRLSDDTDGGFSCMEVAFSPDADGHVSVISQIDWDHTMSMMHRYRTDLGGGRSPRTRTALMVLARAIMLDNADRPQRIPEKK